MLSTMIQSAQINPAHYSPEPKRDRFVQLRNPSMELVKYWKPPISLADSPKRKAKWA